MRDIRMTEEEMRIEDEKEREFTYRWRLNFYSKKGIVWILGEEVII